MSRQAHHAFHEVVAGDHLGHWMFYLQARVDFKKVEILVGHVVEELDCAGRPVVDGFAEFDRGIEQSGTGCIVQMRCGGLFKDLPITPLNGTIAFSQRDHVAFPIAEDLHFDVPGVVDRTLKKYPTVREKLKPEPLRALKGCCQILRRAASQTDATAARSALQHEWVAE